MSARSPASPAGAPPASASAGAATAGEPPPALPLNPIIAGLHKPRVSFAKIHVSKGVVVRAADGSAVMPSQFPLLRVDDASEISRATRAELEEVRALAAAPAPSGTSLHRMAGVQLMEAGRKQRHDEQVRDFEVLQRRFYGELEDAVLAHGRALREGLADVDRRLDALFAHMGDEAVGVAQVARTAQSPDVGSGRSV